MCFPITRDTGGNRLEAADVIVTVNVPAPGFVGCFFVDTNLILYYAALQLANWLLQLIEMSGSLEKLVGMEFNQVEINMF